MYVRTWSTDIDISQLERLKFFATNSSLPCLETRPGCRGVAFLLNGHRWTTQTYWQDRAAINALAEDRSYREIVNDILALDVLGARQQTEVLQLVGGTMNICLEAREH